MVDRSRLLISASLLTFAVFAFGCPDGPDGDAGDTGSDTVEDTVENDAGVDTMDDAADGGDVQNKKRPRPEFRTGDPASCDDDSPPSRCSEDPWSKSDWDPASVVTMLDLTSTEASNCCFDIDYIEGEDNALAGLLSGLGVAGINANQEVAENLTANEPYSDDLILLAEHQGLSQLGQSNPFQINFYLGGYGNKDARNYLTKTDPTCNFSNKVCETDAVGGKTFNIDPRSLEDGSKAQAQVPDATFPTDDSKVNAGPGKVIINLSLATIGQIGLTINGAKIDTDIDTDNSLNGDGVALQNGKLGGYVMLRDLLNLIDRLIKSCDCVDLGPNESAITYTLQDEENEPDARPKACDRENPPAECELKCVDAVTDAANNACSDADGICGQISRLCNQVELPSEYADLDTDGDGQEDALSAGARFEAVQANLQGTAQIVSATNQEVTSGEVTVPRTFMNQQGWVVIHKQTTDSDGNETFGKVIGHSSNPIGPGFDEDITVSLDESVSDGDTLYAMLHVDKGQMGTYEFSDGNKVDVPAKTGDERIVLESFTVSKSN